MLGFIARAAPTLLFLALLAAILGRVMSPVLDVILASPNASGNTSFVAGIQAASDPSNILLVGIISILLAGLGRAMLEADL